MASTVHCVYVQTALPVLALMNNKKFYKDAFGNNGKKYLTSIWRGVAARMGAVVETPCLQLQKITKNKQTEILHITLPQPKTSSEAFSVAFVASVQSGLFKKSVQGLRYFALEPSTENQDEAIIWELASPNPTPTREMQAIVASSDSSTFLSRLDEILQNRVLRSIDASGSLAGSVIIENDGTRTMEFRQVSDPTAFLFSFFLIVADDLPKGRKCFSDWAGFPDLWGARHKEYFAIAMMHYFRESKHKPSNAPVAIRNAVEKMPEQNLPPLHRPLTEEVKTFFGSLFGG